MVTCPNCGRKTYDDYCQWCNYPILKRGLFGRQDAKKPVDKGSRAIKKVKNAKQSPEHIIWQGLEDFKVEVKELRRTLEEVGQKGEYVTRYELREELRGVIEEMGALKPVVEKTKAKETKTKKGKKTKTGDNYVNIESFEKLKDEIEELRHALEEHEQKDGYATKQNFEELKAEGEELKRAIQGDGQQEEDITKHKLTGEPSNVIEEVEALKSALENVEPEGQQVSEETEQLVEKQVSEKAKQPVEQQVNVEAKEAPKAQEAKKRKGRKTKDVQKAKQDIDSEIYEGDVKIVIPSPVGFEQVRQFEESLAQVEGLKIVWTGGSVDEGALITVSVQKPMTLTRTVREIPAVEKVNKRENKIEVMLKTPDVS